MIRQRLVLARAMYLGFSLSWKWIHLVSAHSLLMVIYVGESVFGDQHVDFVVESIYLRHEFVQILNKLENDINKQSVWAKRCICTLWNTPHPSKHFICFYSSVPWTVFRYPNCRQLDFIYNVHANINCMLHHKSSRVIFLSDRADMFSHYQNRAKGTHSRIKIVKFKVDLCKIVHQTCILLLCKDSNVRWFRKN